jgi:glucans biosynthesis protein C
MAAQTELTPSQLPGAGATAPPRQAAAAPPQGKRLLFVDNLRILLISMVLVVHLDDTYGAVGSWDYHDPAKNLLTGTILSIPNAIGMASGMGFFFLLAGYFTPGSYDRKGPRSFLRDRLVRLGLPLLLYDLLLHPLVVYIGSGLHGSYWSFYGNFLLQMRGVTGVVWFLAVLLLFDLLYATWRVLTRHRTQTTGRTGKLPSYRAIFGFIFALGLVTFVVRIWWPAGSIFLLLNVPVGYLPQYISFYILGLIAYRRNWFLELTPKMGRDWSLIALMATLIIFGGVVFPSAMQQEMAAPGTRQAGLAIAGGFNWLAFSYALWESFVVVGVCIGLLVLFRQRWNYQGRLARSLAANVYIVYLIHAPVLVGFAYAFHVVALYPLLKWSIAVLITIPLCFLISSVIRKIPLVNRVL